MNQPELVFTQEAAGERVRIWRYGDGRFLLECLQTTGKGIAVFCPSYEKAMELWCQFQAGGGGR